MSIKQLAMDAYEEIGNTVLGTEALSATRKEKQIVGLLSIMARRYAQKKKFDCKSVVMDVKELKVEFVDSEKKKIGEMKVTTADMARPEKWYEELSV